MDTRLILTIRRIRTRPTVQFNPSRARKSLTL
jgi:hypothetical protein